MSVRHTPAPPILTITSKGPSTFGSSMSSTDGRTLYWWSRTACIHASPHLRRRCCPDPPIVRYIAETNKWPKFHDGWEIGTLWRRPYPEWSITPLGRLRRGALDVQAPRHPDFRRLWVGGCRV